MRWGIDRDDVGNTHPVSQIIFAVSCSKCSRYAHLIQSCAADSAGNIHAALKSA